MVARYQFDLTDAQSQELTWVRDHHPKAHFRTKAAAVLKVAHGQSMTKVAAHGLLKPVDRHQVKTWIVRYLAQGLSGWKVQAGRGRKPAFSPSLPKRRRGGSRHPRGAASQSAALRPLAQ